jgi:hypothetical protein
MRSKVKDGATRTAFWLTIVGVILLLVEIGFSAYARINNGGPFAASSHFSGTDGYRIIAIVGFVSACALAYSLDKLGRVMGLFLALIILWEIAMWYSVYQSFGAGASFEAFAMMLIGVSTICYFLLYVPYNLLLGANIFNKPGRRI